MRAKHILNTLSNSSFSRSEKLYPLLYSIQNESETGIVDELQEILYKMADNTPLSIYYFMHVYSIYPPTKIYYDEERGYCVYECPKEKGYFEQSLSTERVQAMLTEIIIPDGTIHIGEDHPAQPFFENCANLNYVSLNADIEKLEKSNFIGCTSLNSLTYRGTVAEFEAIPKSEIWNAKSYDLKEWITVVHCTDGDWIFTPPVSVPSDEIWYKTTDGATLNLTSGSFGDVTVVSDTYGDEYGVLKFSGDVKEVGTEAFYNNPTLSALYFPEGLESIGNNIYPDGSLVKHVQIPSTITAAMDMCGSDHYGTKLFSLINNSSFTIEEMNIIMCDSNGLKIVDNAITHYAPGWGAVNLEIPDYVESIGDWVFTQSHLESVTIPHSVTHIGMGAFYSIPSLVNIVYDGTMAEMSEMATGGWMPTFDYGSIIHCNDGDLQL